MIKGVLEFRGRNVQEEAQWMEEETEAEDEDEKSSACPPEGHYSH